MKKFSLPSSYFWICFDKKFKTKKDSFFPPLRSIPLIVRELYEETALWRQLIKFTNFPTKRCEGQKRDLWGVRRSWRRGLPGPGTGLVSVPFLISLCHLFLVFLRQRLRCSLLGNSKKRRHFLSYLGTWVLPGYLGKEEAALS